MTHNGYRFFLTIVDDNSRMTWVYLLKFKSDVFHILQSFLSLVQTLFKKQVKRVWSDNETEFFNKECTELFSKQGIVHESSCPYTPQQNGVAERKHWHVLEVSRALRFHGHIPLRFWGECVFAVVYLIFRLPTTILKGKIPYEVFHKVKAKIDHLKTLGCLCYVTRVPKADKF